MLIKVHLSSKYFPNRSHCEDYTLALPPVKSRKSKFDKCQTFADIATSGDQTNIFSHHDADLVGCFLLSAAPSEG